MRIYIICLIGCLILSAVQVARAQDFGLQLNVQTGKRRYVASDAVARLIRSANPDMGLVRLDVKPDGDVISHRGAHYGPGTKFGLVVVMAADKVPWPEIEMILFKYQLRFTARTRIVVLSARADADFQSRALTGMPRALKQAKITEGSAYYGQAPVRKPAWFESYRGVPVLRIASATFGGLSAASLTASLGQGLMLEEIAAGAVIWIGSQVAFNVYSETNRSNWFNSLRLALIGPAFTYFGPRHGIPNDPGFFLEAFAAAGATDQALKMLEWYDHNEPGGAAKLIWPSEPGVQLQIEDGQIVGSRKQWLIPDQLEVFDCARNLSAKPISKI